MKQTKIIATCGMMTALSIMIMLLGGILDIGMYAAPMIAGLCLLPIGHNYGKKYQVMVWVAVSLLSFILVPNLEENLTYLCLFGLYPILYPYFQKLPGMLQKIAKFAYLNLVMIGMEMLLMMFLMPEAMDILLIAVLLIIANATFLIYDKVLPKMETLMVKRLNKLFP